jgi:hypothetical protein
MRAGDRVLDAISVIVARLREKIFGHVAYTPDCRAHLIVTLLHNFQS